MELFRRGERLPALNEIYSGTRQDVEQGDLLAVVEGFYVVGVGRPAEEDEEGNFSWRHESLRKVHRSN
jgi:hypothetical protein